MRFQELFGSNVSEFNNHHVQEKAWNHLFKTTWRVGTSGCQLDNTGPPAFYSINLWIFFNASFTDSFHLALQIRKINATKEYAIVELAPTSGYSA